MSNPIDTNQASEDELEHELNDIVHDALGEVFCRDCEHPRCLNKVKLYKTAIQSLIRTEKLKLLAEVRERVVGEDESIVGTTDANLENQDTLLYTQAKIAQNITRSEQRAVLTKLEAEL